EFGGVADEPECGHGVIVLAELLDGFSENLRLVGRAHARELFAYGLPGLAGALVNKRADDLPERRVLGVGGSLARPVYKRHGARAGCVRARPVRAGGRYLRQGFPRRGDVLVLVRVFYERRDGEPDFVFYLLRPRAHFLELAGEELRQRVF